MIVQPCSHVNIFVASAFAHAAARKRTLVMGVLNITPDSFSDGGAYLDSEAAVARALNSNADGADILDIGGESTRPGASPSPRKKNFAEFCP